MRTIVNERVIFCVYMHKTVILQGNMFVWQKVDGFFHLVFVMMKNDFVVVAGISTFIH